ncbi:MAG: ATP-binding protein, partial [Bryobacteraceae bacterium]
MGFASAEPASPVPLESVIITQELARRPARQPEDDAVNRALVTLAQTMANTPEAILQRLVETALNLCRAHSAGISLLEDSEGRKIFRWHGVAGAYAPHLWGTTPREFSPCGTVLDTDRVQLMSYPDRHFEYFAQVQPRIAEALLIPFHVGGRAVGTIWVISHDQSRQFDAEDKRVMDTLGDFAACAYQVVSRVAALKEARAALEKTNCDLLRTNEELKGEVLERARAEASLRYANAELDRFALAASHDLREPLRTVKVFTQILRQRIEDTVDPETRNLLDSIVDGASRMENLVHDLLEYSRLGAEGTSSFAPTSLEDAVAGALENLAGIIDENHATIVQDKLPVVYADKLQLTLLFQNLIGNSIKYRRAGEPPRIHLSASVADGHWVISVRDNGEGFSPEYAEAIFGAFRRLHGRDIPGTGIGLALCQR